MKNRIQYLDVLKGLAIILVVLGHACNSTEFIVNRYILSFHMPVFFFCSGVLFKTEIKSAIAFLKKKLFTIFVPMLTLGVISVSLEFILSFLNIAKGDLSNPIASFFNWFLLTLFIVECICGFVLTRCKNARQTLIFGGGVLITFLFVNYNEHYIIGQVLAATVFFLAGYLLKSYLYKLREKVSENKNIKLAALPLAAILFAGGVVLCRYNLPILMYINQYGNKVLFLINACLGTAFLLIVSILFENSRILQFIGKNTLIIFITHFAVYRVSRGIWNVLFTDYSQRIDYLSLLVLIIVEIPIIFLANRYIPFLFGKKYKGSVKNEENKNLCSNP